jgi:hypothetical protein
MKAAGWLAWRGQRVRELMNAMTDFVLLTGALALWPRFIEARFARLLNLAKLPIPAPTN